MATTVSFAVDSSLREYPPGPDVRFPSAVYPVRRSALSLKGWVSSFPPTFLARSLKRELLNAQKHAILRAFE